MPRALAISLACAAALPALAAPVAQARPPTLGLVDDSAFNTSRASERRAALDRARRAGAHTIRFTLSWAHVAPQGRVKPDGFRASDPADEGYRWGYVEEFVRDARRRGLRVVLTVRNAPRWAEGRGRPSAAPPGSWRPDPAELAAFVRAAARRFSGFFPDPKSQGDGLTGAGRALPAVRHWQIWDEPNGGRTLLPLERGRGSDGSAARYREMLNSAASALRSVDSDNRVITAGTQAGTRGIAPLVFWRALLCRYTSSSRCFARFDAYAHHPAIGGASPRTVGGGNDVRVASVGRLARVVAAAGRRGDLRGVRRKALWITELGWDTRPPARGGVSRDRQARYLSDAVRLLAGASVDTVIWRNLRDDREPARSPFTDGASGLYRSARRVGGDRPKPALAAFRAPFSMASGRAWGLVSGRPSGARVRIQRRTGSGWRTEVSVRSGRGGQFSVRRRFKPGRYRAVANGVASVPWRHR